MKAWTKIRSGVRFIDSRDMGSFKAISKAASKVASKALDVI